MPTYAYACKQCSHRFDIVQSFADPTLTECPECGGALRKEYGSIGVTFNGSGFYRTDSRAGEKGSGSKTDGSKKDAGEKTSSSVTSGSDGGGGSTSSTSSKSEAKASPTPSGS